MSLIVYSHVKIHEKIVRRFKSNFNFVMSNKKVEFRIYSSNKAF